MSDIRYNGWLHRSGTGGVWQDSSGNVGIGTSVGMTSLINSGPNALTFGTGTTPSERIRITSGGLVGINTDSIGTNHNLEIFGNASAYAVLNVKSQSLSHGASIELGAQDDDNYGSITQFASGASEGGRMKFVAGTTETMNLRGGKLLVGTTSDTSPIGWGNNLQVAGTSAVAGVSIRRDSADTGGALLVFGKSRGSLNGNTVVQSGDQIGGMYFAGGDGTDVNSIAAQVSVEVDGTPGGNDMPGRILFKTTADGAASPTERLRITNAGNVAIGNASPQQLLHVWPDTANTASAYIRVSSGNRGSGTGIDLGSDSDGDGRLNVVSNGNLKLYTNNAERFRIGSSGQLGIGGATYGSSGQVLTSGGASAAPTWGTASAPSIADSDNYSGSHICLGSNAGKYSSSNYIIAIGVNAGQYGTARHNCISIGVNAGRGNSDGSSTTGDENVCVGNYAGEDLTSGSNNSFIGRNAGKDVTTGNSNVIIGSGAASGGTTVASSTIIGHSAGYGLSESNYSVIIGHGASGESLQGDAADNQLFIARQGYGGGHGGTWIYGNSSGQCVQGGGSSSWYTGSDERYKNFLGKYSRGLAAINGLDVQNFKWKDQADMPAMAFNNSGSYCGPEIDGKTKIGVGAQSCEALIPEAVNKLDPQDLDKGGNHMLTLDNDPIFWAAINAIQELSTKIDALTTRVSNLE